MHLSGSKVIAILCITTAISSAIEVLTEVQQRNFSNNNLNNNNKISVYELKLLNEFLDYNQLHRVIIIYTLSTTLSRTKTERLLDNGVNDTFICLPIMRNLTQNNHLQFVNTLSHNSSAYLLHSSQLMVGVFMKYNARDKGKQRILNMISMKEKFNKSLKWLIVMDAVEYPLKNIQERLGNLNILVDADVTVAVYRDKSNFDLYDVYNTCHACGFPLEILYKGNWSHEAGFKILNKFQYGIAVRRNDLRKIFIKAVTVITNKSPTLNMTDLEYLNDDKSFLDEDAMQRKTYQLLKLMEDLFNFTFDVTFSDSWGEPVNGSWTGVIGLLNSHQAEMTVCPMRFLLPRWSALDYSGNIHTEKIHFLFRHPKHTSIRNIFFEPLTDIVWWCVLALIVVAILLLAIHVHAEYKIFTMLQQEQKQPMDDSINANAVQLPVENHFDFIVLCIMEAILMQGPEPQLFRQNSTRLLVVSISIFSILLMQFYGAFIVSSLLSEAPRTIVNLRSLYNSSLEIGLENVSYNFEVFVNSKDPMVRNLYEYRMFNKHTNRPNAMSLEEGAKMISKGNFAFHAAIDRTYRLLKTFLTEPQFCDLQEIKFHLPITFTCGLGIRKSTPYYEYITFAIAKFQEAALLPYNNKKWEVDKIDCAAINSQEVEVDLKHFAPALGFLFFAILISGLAFIIEIVYKRFTK